MRQSILQAVFVGIVSITVASCGGGSKTPVAASPTTSTTAATTSVATTTAATTSIGATSLAGVVTDVVSGSPIAAATVTVQGKSATTGADGRYSITGLTDGAATVAASHQGHRNFTQNSTLAGSTTVNIAMTRAGEANSAGNWTGTWRNTTFNSSGGATMTLAVDTVAQRFTCTIDLSGTVFGRGDPPAETFNVNYTTASGASISGSSGFYGQVSASVSASGAVTGSMVNPAPNISRVDFSGQATTGTIDLLYTVRFTDGSTASGTVRLTR